MLVSIITPSYNAERHLLDTYRSIQKQSYTDWEWLVTDDCSTDGTVAILKKLADEDDRIKLFHNFVNSGAAVSRNVSLSNASGDFVAFLDSDDLWSSSKLDTQLQLMNEFNLNFSFTSYELIDDLSNKLNVIVDQNQNEPLTYADMLRKKATLGCSTVMLRKTAFGEIQMPLLRTGQDYALWLKLLKSGVNAHPIQDVLTQYRILPNSISRNKVKKARRQWQIYREVEELSLFESIECFCFYAWRAVFRK
jgi:glycosyltransferase involved in cell wall biosynthesis